MSPNSLGRRAFVRTVGAGAAFAAARPIAGCVDLGRALPEPLFCDAERYRLLEALVDTLVPPSATHPGALAAGAARYVDRLLGAFLVDPPLVYAGGPFSGRHGGDASFEPFVPLTRIETIRWRTTIEGSQGLRAREFNGPVRGWQDVYCEGLTALDEATRAALGLHFFEVERNRRDDYLARADDAFADLAFEHTLEGLYADPVYGGNADAAAWAAVGFAGDSQPAGYSADFLDAVYVAAKGGA